MSAKPIFNEVGCFQCMQCRHVFKCLPGPFVSCPKCGSVYARWTDYLRFARERMLRSRA